MRVQSTMRAWMKEGPARVAAGATSVELTDRSPDHVVDRITPEGAWGWMYGWRWLADGNEPSVAGIHSEAMECHRYTLPEAVFLCLPACTEYGELQRGTEPRWSTPEAALAALESAAIEWAKSRKP